LGVEDSVLGDLGDDHASEARDFRACEKYMSFISKCALLLTVSAVAVLVLVSGLTRRDS